MYRLNKKNFAVTRVLPRGPEGNKRLNYVRVDRQGSIATDQQMIARVTLPGHGDQPSTPTIYPKATVLKTMSEHKGNLNCAGEVLMDGGLPAQTTADNAVPDLDRMIPKASDQIADFVCDAEELLILLKAALDVSEDADRCIKLRICNTSGLGKTLRIDTLAFPGQQAFLGVVKAMQYDGPHIAGDDEGTPSQKQFEAHATKTPMPLVLSSGRKFRG